MFTDGNMGVESITNLPEGASVYTSEIGMDDLRDVWKNAILKEEFGGTLRIKPEAYAIFAGVISSDEYGLDGQPLPSLNGVTYDTGIKIPTINGAVLFYFQTIQDETATNKLPPLVATVGNVAQEEADAIVHLFADGLERQI